MFWVELTVKRHEDDMIFCFHFFCLGPTVREQLDENNLRHYHGNFFESIVLRLLDHSYLRRSFAIIIRHFDNSIWKIWISAFYGNGSTKMLILSWANIFKTKIDKGSWRIIIYAEIRACSPKNIPPRHFTYYCMLPLFSNKLLVFKFNLMFLNLT